MMLMDLVGAVGRVLISWLLMVAALAGCWVMHQDADGGGWVVMAAVVAALGVWGMVSGGQECCRVRRRWIWWRNAGIRTEVRR